MKKLQKLDPPQKWSKKLLKNDTGDQKNPTQNCPKFPQTNAPKNSQELVKANALQRIEEIKRPVPVPNLGNYQGQNWPPPAPHQMLPPPGVQFQNQNETQFYHRAFHYWYAHHMQNLPTNSGQNWQQNRHGSRMMSSQQSTNYNAQNYYQESTPFRPILPNNGVRPILPNYGVGPILPNYGQNFSNNAQGGYQQSAFSGQNSRNANAQGFYQQSTLSRQTLPIVDQNLPKSGQNCPSSSENWQKSNQNWQNCSKNWTDSSQNPVNYDHSYSSNHRSQFSGRIFADYSSNFNILKIFELKTVKNDVDLDILDENLEYLKC